MKAPYVLVIGDKEIESGELTVRDREGTETKGVPFDAFVDGPRRGGRHAAPHAVALRGLSLAWNGSGRRGGWSTSRPRRSRTADEGCIFCDLAASEDDANDVILARGERAFVMLNSFPYNPGHLMVAPFRHAGEFGALDAG